MLKHAASPVTKHRVNDIDGVEKLIVCRDCGSAIDLQDDRSRGTVRARGDGCRRVANSGPGICLPDYQGYRRFNGGPGGRGAFKRSIRQAIVRPDGKPAGNVRSVNRNGLTKRLCVGIAVPTSQGDLSVVDAVFRNRYGFCTTRIAAPSRRVIKQRLVWTPAENEKRPSTNSAVGYPRSNLLRFIYPSSKYGIVLSGIIMHSRTDVMNCQKASKR